MTIKSVQIQCLKILCHFHWSSIQVMCCSKRSSLFVAYSFRCGFLQRNISLLHQHYVIGDFYFPVLWIVMMYNVHHFFSLLVCHFALLSDRFEENIKNNANIYRLRKHVFLVALLNSGKYFWNKLSRRRNY